MAKDYISEVFKEGDDHYDAYVGDIRQEMRYNLVKTYPSVNSTNGGNIHSEENVRWLTRQFTKKPFIIPYDNNEDFKEFDYEGVELYAGRTNGGMANIDGYVFNMADAITKTSFNNSDDTCLSTGGSGYISHQRLQRAISQFMNGLQSSDFESYNLYTPDKDMDEINTKISNTYKKIIGEPYELPVMDNDKLSVYVGTSVAITYTNADLITYISDTFNLNTLVDDYSDIVLNVTVTPTSITIGYKILFGIIESKIKPVKNDSNVYNSVLFIRDIFGFNYIWKYEDMYVSTHVYPSTLNIDLNFMEDNITYTLADSDVGKTNIKVNTTWKLKHIYDYSLLYKEYTPTEGTPFYTYLENASDAGLWPKDGNDFRKPYIRDDTNNDNTNSLNNAQKDLDNYFNGNDAAFDTVSASDIISSFINYSHTTPTDADFTTDNYHTGKLYKLSDNYYCLPLDRLSTGDSTSVMDFLCLKYNYGNNPNIPVGFLTSSGALMARNYEYGDYLYIEGYVSFIRRVCAKFCNVDYSNTSGTYGDISNPNDYNHEGWNRFIRDFQTGVISFDDGDNASKWANILGTTVNDLDKIKFQDIYNVFIAPYANFHLQLAWSANYIFDLNNSPNAKYKTHHAYTTINDNLDASIQPLTDQEIGLGELAAANIHINLPITHSFTHETVTYNASRAVTYYYNQYTDYGRLDNFLCNKTLQTYNPVGDHAPYDNTTLHYYDKVNLTAVSDVKTLCEDYITYLKHCSAKGYEQTYNGRNVNSNIMSVNKNPAVNILYKVTNLTNSGNTYGFDDLGDTVVDRLAKYVSTNINDYYIDYVTNTTNILPILASHINNVAIRLDTLMPSERNSYEEAYYCYPTQTSDVVDNTNVTLATNYVLGYFTYFTVEYDGAQTYGLSGYGFTGNSQGWVVAVPTLFRLYKDAQNHLQGNRPGTGIHDGINIDYAFPKDVTNYDFWFANSWLSPVSKITTWEIENTGATYPKTTDGMAEYLDKRNSTILSMDKIYNINDNGDYVSSSEYVDEVVKNIEEKATQYTDNSINNSPTLEFVDAVPTPETSPTSLTYELTDYTGLPDNVDRLHKNLSHTTNYYTTSSITSTFTNVLLENNKFIDLLSTDALDYIILKSTNDFYIQSTDYFTHGIDTVNTKLFKMSIKVNANTNFKIYLNDTVGAETAGTSTMLNGNIPIVWSSNCTMLNQHFSATSTMGSYINVSNNIIRELLINITITYNEDNNTAYADCNISYINPMDVMDNAQITSLLKVSYALDTLTWEQVSEYTKLGLAPKLWNLGDTKTFKLYDDPSNPLLPVATITARIIGFNQDGDNTITWMTQATDAEYPYGSLSTAFPINLGKDEHGNALSADGYNPVNASYGITYTTTAPYNWLNDSTNGIVKKIESSLNNIIIPARKVSRPLYLVEDSEGSGTYHKYGGNNNIGYYKHYLYDFPDYVEDNGVALIFEDRYGAYDYGTKLWLPTTYELGASQYNLSTADPYEYSAYTNAITSQNEDVIKYSSLRIDGKCSSWGTYWIPKYNIDTYDMPEFTYDYFKLPESERVISGNYCICRNYYAVLNTDVTDTSVTWDTELKDDIYSKYMTAERYSCLVSTYHNPDSTPIINCGYALEQKDVSTGSYYTEFCFVTY